MNQNIFSELHFFAASTAIGLGAAVLYDMLRVFRRLCRHSLFLISVEDFLFWLAAGVAGFSVVYVYNDGLIRLYAVMGMLLAAALYYMTCSRLFVRIGTAFVQFFLKPLEKGLKKIRDAVKIIISKMLFTRSGKETKESGKKKKTKQKHRI